MSNEEAAPDTKGVTAELLTTVDLGPEIEGMAGRQLRMRMFTFEPGAVFGPIHDHRTDQASSTYCKERSLTTEMETLRTMGREWAGPRIGRPPTGLRTEERFRRWRSRSISSRLPNRLRRPRTPSPSIRRRVRSSILTSRSRPTLPA